MTKRPQDETGIRPGAAGLPGQGAGSMKKIIGYLLLGILLAALALLVGSPTLS